MGAPSKNQQWLDQVKEAALEPELPICDPHHHLWDQRHEREAERYLLDEILDDIAGGHNVVSTVFIECGAMFKTDGPEAYRCVGETEFVNGIAAMSASGMYGKARIAAGIVGTADLRLGDKVADVLDAQIAAGGGRFCGIRRGAFWHASPQIQNHRTNPPEGLLTHADFRAGSSIFPPASSALRCGARTPSSPTPSPSRGRSRIRRSCSTTLAGRSASAPTPASRTRCSLIGRPKSMSWRVAKMWW